MLRTLYAKLALALLGVLLVAAVLVFLAGIVSVEKVSRRSTPRAQSTAGSTAGQGLATDERRRDQLRGLGTDLSHPDGDQPQHRSVPTESRGSILSFSAPENAVVRQQVSMQPIREFLEADLPLPILGDDPRDASGRKVFSVAPIGDKYDSTAISTSSWPVSSGIRRLRYCKVATSFERVPRRRPPD